MKSKWRYPRWYHCIQPEARRFRKQTILFFHSLQICNKNNVCKRNGLIDNLLGWIHLQHTRIAVAFACWNFFLIVFRLINNKNFQQANATAIRVCLQINPPLEFYLGVRTCELFFFVSHLLFSWVRLWWLLCFLCFTSTVRFTGFYTQDGPHFICCEGKFRRGCFETCSSPVNKNTEDVVVVNSKGDHYQYIISEVHGLIATLISVALKARWLPNRERKKSARCTMHTA